MNENLDLTKILDGCPEGTKFYSTIYGNVSFKEIILGSICPIIMSQGIITIPTTKEGKDAIDYYGECTLFPDKNQRDWSKFERFWDKPKSKELNKETYSAKETTTVEKAADVFSEMLVELWPDLLGFGGIAKKLENEFRKRLEE